MIRCSEPGCRAHILVGRDEGRAWAALRAFDLGWTYTGVGSSWRDWCPDHTQPWAKKI